MNLEILREIGLEEKEADIYITLLKFGSSPASKIAIELGFDRTTTYYILLKMINKGFISYVNKGSVKHFSAIEPKQILGLLKEREEHFSSILSSLEKLKTKEEQLNVEIFKGKQGLNNLYRDVIKSKGEVLVFGVDESKFIDFDIIHFKQYIKEVDRGKIKERLLTFEGATSFGSRKSEYRFIPKEFFQPTPIAIYSNKIAMIIWQPSLHIILIESEELVNAFKKHFELLWRMAKSNKSS